MSISYGEEQIYGEEKPKVTFIKAFKMIIPLGIILHGIFLIIFYKKGITLLTYYNIVSVLIYLYITMFGMKKYFFLSTIIIFLEILVHSILCCILIGWTGGFYVYPLCLLPITYFVSINLAKNYFYGHLSAGIILCNYQFWNIYTQYKSAPYEYLFENLSNILYNINTISATIILVILLFSFLYEMRYIQDMLEKKNKILNNLANFDMLTELRNRRSIIEEINKDIDNYNKFKTGFFIAIADIDNFKMFNDTYGHDCGDILLKETANILKSNSQKFSIEVSRWGGEEFLILIRYDNQEEAKNVCETILNDIRNFKIEYNEMLISVTITIGCAYFGNDCIEINKVLKRADINLYEGKTTTKNCVVLK